MAEAATAAAQSATAASVVDLEAIQAMGATKPSPFASEAFEDAVTGAGISRAATNSRISRRTSAEPTALPSQRPPSGTAALAQQRIFDEAVKKLEHTARVRGRLAPKSEDAFTDPMQDGRDRTEASSDIMTPMSYVGEDMLRRSDVMRDLEIPKDDFGVFDSIDLSPFDQNSSGALGYATPDYRGHSLELDDG